MKFGLITSWNVWGIPFGSWGLYGRSRKWLPWLDEVVPTRKDVLVVHAFQEAWGWRSGVFGYVIEVIFGLIYSFVPFSIIFYPIEMIFVLFSLLIGWIIGPWYYFDAKKNLKRKGYFVLGLEESYHPWKLFDSGLLMISSHPSTKNGFMSWKDNSKNYTPRSIPIGIMRRLLIWTEQFANKGAQWAYFSPDILIINVHLAGPYVVEEQTKDQLKQLEEFIKHLKQTFGEELTIYCVGDLNCNPMVLKDFLQQTELTNLNQANHPTHWSGKVLDYILTNKPMSLKINTPPGCSRFFRLSDHSLLQAYEPELEPFIKKM